MSRFAARISAVACIALTAAALTAPAHAERLRFAHQNAEGGVFKRAGHTTRNADGSMQHDSGFKGNNNKGSVQSQGSATRDAQGDVTQNRTTTATSASTGNTAVSTSSYSKDGGVDHSVNCFDATGAAISCPKK